jgi:hypothetical protein
VSSKLEINNLFITAAQRNETKRNETNY